LWHAACRDGGDIRHKKRRPWELRPDLTGSYTQKGEIAAAPAEPGQRPEERLLADVGITKEQAEQAMSFCERVLAAAREGRYVETLLEETLAMGTKPLTPALRRSFRKTFYAALTLHVDDVMDMLVGDPV
jgi:hypothetical protein